MGEKRMEIKKILIAAPVYQKTEIFIEYLNSINHLIIPEGYEAHKYYVITNSPEIEKLLSPNEYETDNYDFEKEKEKGSHIWDKEHFNSVMEARNKILKYARKNNYDYIFSVDSDILLHPKTLQYLLEDNKDMVGIVYRCSQNNKIGTNYYYGEYHKGYPDLERLIPKGIYEVGIACASVLIGPRIVNNEKINYSPIKGVPFSQWEDYAFSLRAHALIPDLQVYMDTRLPARELTNEKEYKRWIKEKEIFKIEVDND
jgi:hypothetical protein